MAHDLPHWTVDFWRALAALVAGSLCITPSAAADPVRFHTQIRPILDTRCGVCHGAHSDFEGGVKFTDAKAAFMRSDSGAFPIVAGSPPESALWARVTSDDPELRMPPEGDSLTDAELSLIREWIISGADWPRDETTVHWAYRAPQKTLPPPDTTGWSRGLIDQFVRARMSPMGLSPSDQAEPARLLRRLFLDLIGLPPSVDTVNRFIRDPSDAAYERIVDKLLASPRYGEKWARHWLDLARYSDSNGYQADQIREMWAFRDWVIESMNVDMPYDQFTVEQLAGDLLPDPTPSQRIATGFHRATTCNVEAGVDPEANRTDQVIDRVNTTGTTWLATTLECAQCHNHKYDPISQQEYYELFAFFNNTPMEVKQEKKGSVQFNFYGPKMQLPVSKETEHRRLLLETERARLKAAIESAEARLLPKFAAWLVQQRSNPNETPEGIRPLLRLNADELSDIQSKKLQEYYFDADPSLRQHRLDLATVEAQLVVLEPPTTLVMQELPAKRETTIFVRGNFLQQGASVEANVPGVLGSLPKDAPPNRLGFAQWLVDPRNPLTARVAVNRWWYELFGRGLVASIDDFGAQGDPPTHPRLLDWLALELQLHDWSMKWLHKTIVMSSTYRQTSHTSEDQTSIDPQNKWLSRGPRNRLPAELIRDNALAISGQLNQRMKGPPVYPPQPEGLWHQTGRNEPVFVAATNGNRHRRGVYVVWRRAAPYPSFTNFDAPDRMTCVACRPNTNTPLQALTLLNDDAYVELAKAMAVRVMRETEGQGLLSSIEYAVKLTVSRAPRRQELELLQELFKEEHAAIQADSTRVDELTRGTELTGLQLPEDAVTWATWFSVCSALLNLDETISK